MIQVSWQDEKASLPEGATFLDVKKAFGWKNDVLMVLVDGKPRELRDKVPGDCSVEPLTFRDEAARNALRHSTAHILAQAVKRLYPETRLGIGPSIEDGFYYDFDAPVAFGPDELEKIEEEMKRIISENEPIVREFVEKAEARKIFQERNEPYKLEILEEIPDGEPISIYRQGEFVDLCSGPHVPSTGYVKAMKLLNVAGAYWRGNEKNPMLQRIYGTSFMDQKELDDYLVRLEEIKKRDHRKLGKDLDLFSIEEEGGPGLVYWHPKGAIIREIIEDFWRKEHRKRGYQLVYTPHIAKLDLWKVSGHWNWYKENMYSPMVIDEVEYLLKPMNCPFHILIFKGDTRSYRDLPIKYGELGTVYRYERSGVLHGMLRVRGFTQDDAHIFCRPDQLEDELVGVLDLASFMLETFGYDEYYCMLSVRDPENKEKYIGDDEVWETAENALERALQRKGLNYKIDPGEAKFYGPAIDIKVKDAVGRLWQGPTIQVDFNLPERFDISYIGEDGEKHRPVIIHRTVLGTMERFIGGLIEHYAGAFPLWLAPVQMRVIPVSEKQSDYAQKVTESLRNQGYRVECDLGSEKIGYKIRKAQLEKIPYMLVVGSREREEGTLSVRHRSLGDLGTMRLDEFVEKAREEVEKKLLDSIFSVTR
ncbi:MAG: threonine--tRNA ligase [Candidatus Fermentithermobacillus carboniphilus]|uniref:Threonine--tRNA ligase n=1 Tax=Candidatus Fermentithermobacillus carboniphilus TaxID=3085328 RepID=A0AAT9LBN6_9FIRM|nr:MAG: threonine--tRNA ligase [Candidatus Fermentithermobacillus carboniphilus]